MSRDIVKSSTSGPDLGFYEKKINRQYILSLKQQ